jgi:hypothetical protein
MNRKDVGAWFDFKLGIGKISRKYGRKQAGYWIAIRSRLL